MTLSEIEVGDWFVYRGKIYSKGNGVIMALGQFLVNCEILGELLIVSTFTNVETVMLNSHGHLSTESRFIAE